MSESYARRFIIFIRNVRVLARKTVSEGEQETAFLLEEFMNRRYEFRYNTVLDDLEYRQRDSIHFTLSPWTNVCATVSLSVP